MSLKGLEYLLGFILLPFLVRTLGVERFGAIAFMQGIIQYFVILTDYGFNMTAPRDLAKSENEEEIAGIFTSVVTAKILICTAATAIFLTGAALFRHFYGNGSLDIGLFWAVYPLVIGNIVFPIWFFQGIQQMRYITVVSVMARIVMTGLIFILVRGPADYLTAAFLQSCTMALAGFFSIFILFREYPFVFRCPNRNDLVKTLKDGWQIFVSTIAVNIYTTTNLVVLGMLTNNSVVGYFSAANKIIEAFKGLTSTVTQAVYPHVSHMLQESEEKAVIFLKRFFRIYCGLNFIGSILLILLAWLIVRILFGTGYEESVNILMIMGVLPLIISFSNVFGTQTMLAFGWQKDLSKILVGAAVFSLLIVCPLTMIWQGEGTALTMVLTEMLVTACTGYYVTKIKKIRLF